MIRTAWTVLCAVVVLLIGGCAAGSNSDELTIDAGGYNAAFDAAREVLRDARFDVERVDARAGVLTTSSKATAGIATPWDAEQQTIGDEFGDLLSRNRRQVRITFETVAAASTPPPPADDGPFVAPAEPDLREIGAQTAMRMRVRVLVERVEKPGWRPDPGAVYMSTYYSDPELARRGMEPRYSVPLREDPECAKQIVAWIRDRLAGGG